MGIDVTSPRSRRALLGAVVGAGAATVASAVRPLSTEAADGDPVILGHQATNENDIYTQIRNALWTNTYCNFASPGTYAVFGTNDRDDYPAIEGVTQAQSGSGVWGHLASVSQVNGAIGVLGQTAGHHSQFGVRGVADPEGVGVHGKTQNGIGVLAEATGGWAVKGQATTGRGVYALATTGYAVRAEATSGVGVWGQATTGYALQTDGRVRFDKSAGKATIAAGTSSVVVTPGIDLTASSAVVATLNGNAGGSTTVKRVTVNTTSNTFTIYLTANSTASVKVAWHVFG
jgi:hypothetical protein